MSAATSLYWDEPDYEPDFEGFDEPERPRDPMVDAAKASLRRFFDDESSCVFYKRQLQVIFEAQFYHWITGRALTELAAEGHIASDTERMPIVEHITFFRAKTHRFWKRQATEIKELVAKFSDPVFTAALGAHGEQMFDAALPAFGFMPKGRKVRSYNGRTWTETGHDLDRIFERDGIAYGAEIKNTLKYIPREEFHGEVENVRVLGVAPVVHYALCAKELQF